MQHSDNRWQQRFAHFERAFDQLQRFGKQSPLNEMEKQGFIKAFEYTYELAWNTLKDYLRDKGTEGMYGPRDVVEMAFANGIISDGKVWMDMIKDRNLTVHTYNESTANAIIANIRDRYLEAFTQLFDRLKDLQQ
jgi:nucleotidyltransferase substrate binding protein (TIGR01987 family)